MPSQNKRKLFFELALSLPLSSASAPHWAEMFETKEYPSGQYLFYEEHFPIGAFFLQSGGIQLCLFRKKKVLRTVRAPSLLGLLHCVLNQKYPYCAQTVGSVQASFIPKRVIHEWIQSKNDFLLKEIEMASQRLQSDAMEWIHRQIESLEDLPALPTNRSSFRPG